MHNLEFLAATKVDPERDTLRMVWIDADGVLVEVELPLRELGALATMISPEFREHLCAMAATRLRLGNPPDNETHH